MPELIMPLADRIDMILFLWVFWRAVPNMGERRVSTIVEDGICDTPFDGMAIIDCTMEASCQLEVLGREEPGRPDNLEESFGAWLARCDLIGESTFSSTLREDPEVWSSFFSCRLPFPLRFPDLADFFDLEVCSGLTSWGIYPAGYERIWIA
jgi:hypothetical protein